MWSYAWFLSARSDENSSKDAISVVQAPALLSFHLKELVQAGLVTQERQGRNLIYRASFDSMNELLSYLTENCCAGEALRALMPPRWTSSSPSAITQQVRCAPSGPDTPPLRIGDTQTHPKVMVRTQRNWKPFAKPCMP